MRPISPRRPQTAPPPSPGRHLLSCHLLSALCTSISANLDPCWSLNVVEPLSSLRWRLAVSSRGVVLALLSSLLYGSCFSVALLSPAPLPHHQNLEHRRGVTDLALLGLSFSV